MSQNTFPNALSGALAHADGGAVTRPLPFNNHPHNAVSSAPVGATPPVQSVPNYTGMTTHGAPAGYAPTQGGAGVGYTPNYCKHGGFRMPLPGTNTTIVADKVSELERRSDLALIVDCSDADPKHYAAPALILPEGFRSLSQFYQPTPAVQIPWPDYGTPRLPAGFWEELVRLMPDGLVGVGCVGGHGRTGSALVAIRMVAFGEAFLTALERVRKDYCDSAVETMGQRVYLRDIGIALGTTRKGSADNLPGASARYQTIGQEIAAAKASGAHASASTGGYQSWRDERDAGFASIEFHMEDGAAEYPVSKKARKRFLKRQRIENAKRERQSARLAQDDAARGEVLTGAALERANDETIAKLNAAAEDYYDELARRADGETHNKAGMA